MRAAKTIEKVDGESASCDWLDSDLGSFASAALDLSRQIVEAQGT